MNEQKNFRKINVGAQFSFGETGFFGKIYDLMYSGMPNKDTYALTLFSHDMYCHHSAIAYFNKDNKVPEINGCRMEVEDVNPNSILLRYAPRQNK